MVGWPVGRWLVGWLVGWLVVGGWPELQGWWLVVGFAKVPGLVGW